ncbi:MAG: hypothetical protein ACYDCO_27875 [Armatimonadota bacterium]
MEALKIWSLCVAAAVLYGILHDQITVRVCPEYFTVYHPHLIDTSSLTVLAIAWGVAATWWVGAALGIPVAICARVGRNPRLSARQLLLPIGILLLVMGVSAMTAGLAGYFLSPYAPDRFNADYYAHNASYLAGEIGGLALCLWLLFTRWRLRGAEISIDRTPGAAG